MDVKLVVLGGKRPGQEITVSGPEFLVGRAPECKLRPNSDMVSRRHCMVTIGEGKATIRDLGSRNGTILNGERITGERELRTGDKVRIGPLEFEVHLSTSIGGKKPKVHNVQEAAARTVEAARPRNSEPDLSDWLAEEDDGDTKANKLTTTYVPAPARSRPRKCPTPRRSSSGSIPWPGPVSKRSR